ncbi:MAG: outer membrane protein assembly factor BamD [Alphaproteobacteria bacterium]
MRYFLTIICLMMMPTLTACSSNDKERKVITEDNVDRLYNDAGRALDEENYITASRLFEEVERQHPYSKWATKAQLMAGYSYYEAQRYDDAILALDRFIDLHPGHKDVAYAYYLRALCFYEQISDVRRDQAMTGYAMEAFDAVINRFPDSQYARDAKLKKDLTRDHLAGKEMEIGRYYLNRNQINAAINRFQTVVKDYQTTTHTAEALHRLIEAYLTLGLKEEATKIAAVLGHNYPGNEWYERSFALLDDEARARIVAERGIVDRTVDSIFKPD